MRQFSLTLVFLLSSLLLAEGCTVTTGRESGMSPTVRTTYVDFGRTTIIAIVNATPFNVNIYKFDSSEKPIGSLVPLGVMSVRYHKLFINRRRREEIGLIAIAFDGQNRRVGYETKEFRPRNRRGTEFFEWEIRLRRPRGLRR